MIKEERFKRCVTVRIVPEEPRAQGAPTTGEDPESTTAVDPRPDRVPARIEGP